jgi:putative ABC transport system permease protein
VILGQLLRIAKRNVFRHRAQAIAAAAAVSVGITVLTASLLAGQSARTGIREVAFDVLGETDEMVRSEGDFFFPEDAYDDFATEVQDRRPDVTTAPSVFYPAAATTTDGLNEPDAFLSGIPPDEPVFEEFDAVAGADSLTEGALVNRDLARELDLEPGDEVTLRYTKPFDPVVPTVRQFDGNVSGTSPTVPEAPIVDEPDPAPPEPAQQSYDVGVPDTATRMVAVLGWGSPENQTDLDLDLVAPNGTVYTDADGSTGDPDVPAIVNASAAEGNWTVRVRTEAAANQPFRLFVLVLEPAYSLEELREGQRKLERLGPIGARIESARPQGSATFEVAGVVSGDGKGSYTGRGALFVPLERAQSLLDRPDEINLVRVSNPGGPREGLERTNAVTPDLEEALNATKSRFDEPSVQALGVEKTKANLADRAEQAGSQFTRFLTTLSSFTILAGVLLVVNLFTMLGEERRVELSVQRALGLQRRHLTAAITLEGTLYALPGVPLGLLGGIGLAKGLIDAVNAFVVQETGIPIPFVLDGTTLLISAIVGLAFTVGAVAITGWRLSKLHIASGLDDRRAPAPDDEMDRALVALVAGLALSALFPVTGFYTLLLVGPALAIGGLVAKLLSGTDYAAFGASLTTLPYLLSTIFLFGDVTGTEGALIPPIRGMLMVLASVIAILDAPGLVEAFQAGARKLGSWSPAAVVAVSYPTKRKLRTGMTASMFALVLLVLIFFSSFFNVFQVDPEREAGGYDVYATTRLPVDDLETWAQENLDERPASLDRIERSDAMPRARIVGGDTVTIAGEPPNYQGPPVDVFYGVTDGFVEHNEYELVTRADEYATDREAYEAVASDPSTVLVSRAYDFDGQGRLGRVQGGETLSLTLTSRTENFTVAGAQAQQYLPGVFMSEDTVRNLFPSHGSGILAELEGDVSADEARGLAQTLERDFQDAGMDAESMEAEARELQQANARFFTVLRVFLGLGLVIGVASLGIVTAKSALEREHELGVLRAMGLSERQITASLVGEALFTAILGIVPGIFVGLAAAYAAFLAFFSDVGATFTVPWSSILVLAGVSLVATLASTVPPAIRAARQDIAQAVRVER